MVGRLFYSLDIIDEQLASFVAIYLAYIDTIYGGRVYDVPILNKVYGIKIPQVPYNKNKTTDGFCGSCERSVGGRRCTS